MYWDQDKLVAEKRKAAIDGICNAAHSVREYAYLYETALLLVLTVCRNASDFSETIVTVLTAGCLRLNAVLYLSCKEFLLGYDIFVKDNPASPE